MIDQSLLNDAHYVFAQKDVSARLIKKREVDLVFLDLSKAFDMVNHRLLIAKMKSLSISPGLWNWVAAFLNHLFDNQFSPSPFSLKSHRVRGDFIFQIFDQSTRRSIFLYTNIGQ